MGKTSCKKFSPHPLKNSPTKRKVAINYSTFVGTGVLDGPMFERFFGDLHDVIFVAASSTLLGINIDNILKTWYNISVKTCIGQTR